MEISLRLHLAKCLTTRRAVQTAPSSHTIGELLSEYASMATKMHPSIEVSRVQEAQVESAALSN
jgi:hypothetical protein